MHPQPLEVQRENEKSATRPAALVALDKPENGVILGLKIWEMVSTHEKEKHYLDCRRAGRPAVLLWARFRRNRWGGFKQRGRSRGVRSYARAYTRTHGNAKPYANSGPYAGTGAHAGTNTDAGAYGLDTSVWRQIPPQVYL